MSLTQKQINLKGKKITYTFKRMKCARYMRLSVNQDGSIVVTAPQYYPIRSAESFLREKAAWIAEQIKYFKQFQGGLFFDKGKAHYLKHREEARNFIEKRIGHFNSIYQFTVNKISIKNQRTLWGSCSAQGNLNFNYKMLFLSKCVADYVIVHELCHIRELNHSSRFWRLVARAIPDYQKMEQELCGMRAK